MNTHTPKKGNLFSFLFFVSLWPPSWESEDRTPNKTLAHRERERDRIWEEWISTILCKNQKQLYHTYSQYPIPILCETQKHKHPHIHLVPILCEDRNPKNPSLKNQSILSYHLAIWSSCCRSFTNHRQYSLFLVSGLEVQSVTHLALFSSTLSSYLTWLVPASSNLRAETNGSYMQKNDD